MKDQTITKTVSAHPTSWDYDDVESTEPEHVNPAIDMAVQEDHLQDSETM